jgi:hypothetical protein
VRRLVVGIFLWAHLGGLYKSDHYEFAKAGAPILWTINGLDVTGKPAGYVLREMTEYNSKHYHKVSDEVSPDLDLSGVVEDLRLLFETGYLVAQTDHYPK